MSPIQLADKHLGEYIEKGYEIVPTYCPFCKGGQHHDRGTFALNTDPKKMTYNCRRGKCGATGAFFQLCHHFGEQADSEIEYRKNNEYKPKQGRKTKAKLVVPQIEPISAENEKYLLSRGITRATIDKVDIGTSNGNLVFVYKEDGIPVLYKFKLPRKPEAKEGGKKPLKAWQSGGGKAVLWGLDKCNTEKPLIIVEGEPDRMVCIECGIDNVVSVPFGTADASWIENQWLRLREFKEIILWYDNDKIDINTGKRAGDFAMKIVAARLEKTVLIKVCTSKWKDANIVLFKDGKQAVRDVIKNAKPIPIASVLVLADVSDFDPTKIQKIPTGFVDIDKVIGGLLLGYTSLITGKSCAGKSTVVNTMIASSVNEGFGICMYSGELTAPFFRYWVELTMAGRNNIKTKYNDEGPDAHFLPQNTKTQIRDWYRPYIHIYDNTLTNDAYKILDIFKVTASRYGTKLFILDNLMTLNFNGASSEDNKNHSKFIQELTKFAKKFNVHVMLVAHPKKVYGEWVKADDIKGTGDLFNAVDTVLCVHRLEEHHWEEHPGFCGYNALLEIFKNRIFSIIGKSVLYRFDVPSKRFSNTRTDIDFKYGWEQSDQMDMMRELGWKEI